MNEYDTILMHEPFSLLGNILVPTHNVQHYQRQSQYTARKYSVVTNWALPRAENQITHTQH